MLDSGYSVVAVHDCGHSHYPTAPPFHPNLHFPEYPFDPAQLQPDNWVYNEVRSVLHELGLDADRFGTADWNPLGTWVRRGDRVVIKPNLVISEHELGIDGLLASVAHGSIIRALIDFAP